MVIGLSRVYHEFALHEFSKKIVFALLSWLSENEHRKNKDTQQIITTINIWNPYICTAD